jgi:hypothetical protein
MGKVIIKGGTPTGSSPLCKTCLNAQIMVGFRESEQIVMCDNVQPNIVVPFPVYECTAYYDKNRPTWEQMKELAITVTPAPLKPVGFKTGFHTAAKVRVGDDMDEAEDDD